MKLCGHVYDVNGKPLSDIRVSDGMNVCLTDKGGAFSLDGWEKAVLVFCSVLTNNLHDWYFPIKGHEGDFDFYLNIAEDRNCYSFLHLSDTEIKKGECEGYLPWVRECIQASDAAFILHGGDICYEEGMVCHREEMNEKTVGCPVRYSIGNHDFLDGTYGEERYEELYGPIWYSFDIGEICYVVLAIPKRSGGFASGYTFEEQCRWLENDRKASKNKKMITFRHNAFTEGENYCAEFDNFRFDFAEHGLIAWIQGHAHTNFLMEKGTILHMCSSRPDCGGIDNTAGSMRRVDIKGDQITTEVLFHTLPFQADCDAIWTQKLPGNIEFATLLETSGSIFAATCDEGYPKKCGIYCIDSISGDIRWFFETANSIKNDFAMDEDCVYAEDCEGTVYAIYSKNGKLKWKTALNRVKRHTRGSVIISNNTLYVGTGQHPFFLNKENGEILFEGELVKKGDSAPARTILDDDRKTVYYNAQWFRLLALDAKSGATKWDLRSQKAVIGNNGAFWYRTNTPIWHNGKIYAFGFGYGAIVDAETGEILLHKKVGVKTEVTGNGLIEGDLLYLPTGKQGVVVFDKNTLEEKWRYPVGDAVVFTSSYVSGPAQTVETSPQIIDDEIVFAASDGYVYFYDKNTPQLKKRIKLAYPTLSSPIIRGNFLYAASFDGTVGKYSLSEKNTEK